MTSLTGTNIRLRALEPGDIDLLYSWENDPAVWNVSNTITPFSRLQVEQYVLNSQNDFFAARQLRLMIDLAVRSADEQTIGTIDLFDFEPLHRRAGVGILICEPFRAKGYAMEAMALFIKYAFSTLHLHQLHCNIREDNIQSIRLFEKLGFVKCGIKKDWLYDGHKWQEEWMFQLIPHDE